MKRAHILVSGRVQGVFFRAHVRALAHRLGLKGFVRNLPDGRVEVVAEGDEQRLAELISWCHHGPPEALVSGVEVSWEPPTGAFGEFAILY